MKIHTTFLATALLLAAGASLQAAQDTKAKQEKPAKTDEVVIAEQAPSYPLDTCVVSGKKMEKVVETVIDGHLVRTCCDMCPEKVKAEPAKFIAKIEAAVVAAQKPSYPLETCPISSEKLGEMGEPLDQVHGTRLVRLCCKSCLKGLQKDPAAALAKVDAALIEAQKKTYALDTCPVSGEKLGEMGEPLDVLYGVQLVRLCCKGCMKDYKADPAAVAAKVKEASAKKGEEKKG